MEFQVKFRLSEKHTKKNAQSSSCFVHLLSKSPNHEEDFFEFVCFSESPNFTTNELFLKPYNPNYPTEKYRQ